MEVLRVISATVLLLVVAGIAVPYADSAAAEGAKAAMLAGAGGHHASGTVTIKKGRTGRYVLVLSDFTVDRLPDGRVHLAKGGDYTRGVEIGRLEQFSGTLSFPVPAGVDPGQYDSVVIWCHKFSVPVGEAYFGKPKTRG